MGDPELEANPSASRTKQNVLLSCVEHQRLLRDRFLFRSVMKTGSCSETTTL